MVSHRYKIVLRSLAVLIMGLMALGAGVRAMNAGLACPDWPLCFGKVIPDFHPAVWFEFVHRACAGMVSIIFVGCLVFAFAVKSVPARVRSFGIRGLLALIAQIVFGALTVRLQVRSGIVTTHLMLATLFFLSVLWMNFELTPMVDRPKSPVPRALAWLALLPVLVFVQIFLGGFVASTYAGSVCVDWPLCNGQWVPTWTGAIGLQIVHRFVAYGLTVLIGAIAFTMWRLRKREWMTTQIFQLSQFAMVVVVLQVMIGIANLMFYIPPAVTVVHQSVGILLLAVTSRLGFVAVRVSALEANQAARPVRPEQTLPFSNSQHAGV